MNFYKRLESQLCANGFWSTGAFVGMTAAIILMILLREQPNRAFFVWGVYNAFLGLCIGKMKNIDQEVWGWLLAIVGIVSAVFSLWV
jgi:hypothetical protein